MITDVVVARVVSDTITFKKLEVPAEVDAFSVRVGVVKELGNAKPQVLDGTGAVCSHVHRKDKPAATPVTPDDDDDDYDIYFLITA